MPNWKKIIVSGSDASLSSAYIEGNLTASAAFLTSASIGHLETIYETASVIYSSGSTKFGDTSDDTHERTGSLLISGGITLVEGGSLIGTASIADIATTSSHTAGTASIADLATTASQADNATTASHIVTASFADSSTTSSHTAGTASIANSAVTASHTAGTASIANNATSASYASTGDGVFSGSFSGSFAGVNPFPFTGSGEMQGTLVVESLNDYIDDYAESYFAGTAIRSDGDIALTGSIFGAYQNANSFTGSFLNDTGYIVLTEVSESLNFADDSAAQAGGVPLGGLYRNGSDIKIRIS